MSLLDQLKQIETFAKVPEDQLQWLIDHSECRNYERGALVFENSQPADYMIITLRGRLRFWMEQNGESREIARIGPGEITGILPYSRLKKFNGNSVALEDTEILLTHREVFPEMIRSQYDLTEILVHRLTSRIRDFTTRQQQNEKLLSLGKLSAGLAHELNNPASAVVRAAQDLKDHLTYLPGRFKRVIKIRMEDPQIDAINHVIWQKVGAGPIDLPLLARNDREDEITDWLEDHDIEGGDDFVENLVDFDFREEDLDFILEQATDQEIAPIIGWVDQVITTERLVGEIREASERISGLVKSVKSYSHMDKANDRQPVSVKEGIYNTLMMLKHRIKKQQITLDKHFPEDLPLVQGFPGELNQVWTNIIDNAFDAMPDGGTLKITAIVEGPSVCIRLRDSGTGIPADVLPRIFDPFFTTKGMTEGTGLGLDVVQRIIRNHRGTIEVDSEPGWTEFHIMLPIAE